MSRDDEGRGRLRKARGRCLTTVNPGISEWGNPLRLGNQTLSSLAECIGQVKSTQGTETSKYLQERKSTETPSVAASESGFSPNRVGNQMLEISLQRLVSGSGLRALEELQRHR